MNVLHFDVASFLQALLTPRMLGNVTLTQVVPLAVVLALGFPVAVILLIVLCVFLLVFGTEALGGKSRAARMTAGMRRLSRHLNHQSNSLDRYHRLDKLPDHTFRTGC